MTVLFEEGKAIDCQIVDEKTLSILSVDRLKILKELAREPLYPAQLARLLRMQVQTVYYHMRLLEREGLIELFETQEKGGVIAKKFKAKASSVAAVINPSWKNYSFQKQKIPSFLEGFVSSGFLDAKLVLGSPDAHGKYRSRGSEFCAAELAMYLGSFCQFSYPLYFLDTELKEKKQNLIVLGGPKVNSFTEEINSLLPIRFNENFDVYSSISGKVYPDNVGFISSIQNPFDLEKKILVLAGSNHSATRVAVLAVLKERKAVEAGNLFDSSKFAKVVQGFDEDGDGIVDCVEVLE